eukprot:CFRG2738T1
MGAKSEETMNDILMKIEESNANTHKTIDGPHFKNVKIAPFNVSSDRRLQTLAVTAFWWVLPVSIAIFLLCVFTPPLWILLIPYTAFWLTDNAPETGGRRFDFLRRLKYWEYFRDFFPCILVKEAEIDPTKNYIFGYHPHGIISMGAMCNFGSEATGISEKFPGIQVSLCTLASNFTYPFMRDWFMGIGLVSVSRKSITYILNSGPGKSVAIVLGGAAESLNAVPKTADLTLRRRKGFVKIALQQGAGLVPVFCFGENDIFTQYKDEKIEPLQKDLVKHLGFALPIFHGRGFFQYSFGLTPMRKPMITIVGKPIDLPKLKTPTKEDVDHYHELYTNALTSIYDRYKQDLAPDRKSSIRIVS